jgi:hypothetical protein
VTDTVGLFGWDVYRYEKTCQSRRTFRSAACWRTPVISRFVLCSSFGNAQSSKIKQGPPGSAGRETSPGSPSHAADMRAPALSAAGRPKHTGTCAEDSEVACILLLPCSMFHTEHSFPCSP